MTIPELFKYNSLISIPLFAFIALTLVRKAPDFSFKRHTVSKSVHFLNNPIYNFIFRFNFILKALLDLCFALYVLNYFKIPLTSFISLLIISSAFLFGTLAYFVEGKHSAIHKIIVYLSGTLWATGYLLVSRLTGSNSFIFFSEVFLLSSIILAFGFYFAKKTNVFVQALCMGIWYIWILVFVFQYL